MFIKPFPDMNIGATGATQGTSDFALKTKQVQENKQEFTNTIFAKLDSDKGTTVTKSEAQQQISQGFSLKAIMPTTADAFIKFTKLTGFSDLNQYIKDLYNKASGNFQEINSGKIELSEGENETQAQQQLDSNVQSQISEQIKNINSTAQEQYAKMFVEASLQAKTEIQEQQETLDTKSQQQNTETSIVVNNDYSGDFNTENVYQTNNKPNNNAGLSLRGANIVGKTDSGDSIKVGASGIKLTYNDISLGTNFSDFSAGFNKGNISASLQHNLKNGEGSVTFSWRI